MSGWAPKTTFARRAVARARRAPPWSFQQLLPEDASTSPPDEDRNDAIAAIACLQRDIDQHNGLYAPGWQGDSE